MGWNNVLTILNTADTFLLIFVILLSGDRIAYWWGRMRRWRHAKDGKQPLGKAGEEEA